MPNSQLSKATIARIALLSLAAQYEDQGADPDKGIDLAQADIDFLTARHEDATADLCGAIREIQARRWHLAGPSGLSIRFEGGVLAGIDLCSDLPAHRVAAQVLSACGISEGDVRVIWEASETGSQVATVRPA
jgi:hypothetical protein